MLEHLWAYSGFDKQPRNPKVSLFYPRAWSKLTWWQKGLTILSLGYYFIDDKP